MVVWFSRFVFLEMQGMASIHLPLPPISHFLYRLSFSHGSSRFLETYTLSRVRTKFMDDPLPAVFQLPYIEMGRQV